MSNFVELVKFLEDNNVSIETFIIFLKILILELDE